MSIIDNIGDLILEMQHPYIYNIGPRESDSRDPREISDVYEYIDRVREDNSLSFAQKSQMIEDKINGRMI